MTTAYTSLLGLALPVTGELAGTWGDTVNDYISKYVDAAVAGAQTISGSQTAVTLSVTNGSALTQAGGSGSTGSAQYSIINCTGNPAGLLTITAPAASKVYLILNSTSTSQSVKIVGTGPTTGVTVATGKAALVAWNGSDFTLVATNDASKISGVLAAANGGTGQSSYTTGDLLYASGATALSKLGIGTNGQILTSSGTAPQWSTLSGVAVTTFSAGTTGFTPNSATSGAITLAGTLATTNGGTGLTSFTANGVVYASSTSALATGSALTFDGTNLGLGVTLTAWGSGQIWFEQPTFSIGSNKTLAISYLATNAKSTDNGVTWTYKVNGYAPVYVMQAGEHQWYTTASGTAGAAISFTQAMTLNASGFLGVGETSPNARIHTKYNGRNFQVQPSTSTTQAYIGFSNDNYASNRSAIGIDNSTGTGLWVTGGAAYSLGIGTVDSNPIVFATANAERARIDSSGNVGIGTSSPSYKLDVVGAIQSSVASGNGSIYVNNSSLSGKFWTFIPQTSSGESDFLWYYGGTSAGTRMTLTNTGNLGLGVTPSAFESPWRALQITPGAGYNAPTVLACAYDSTYLLSNTVYTGGFKYIANNYATQYQQYQGQHRWHTAPSGTAGNAITFTQAMTLDASGNLGVGVTSMKGRLALINQVANGNYAQDYTASSSADGQAVFNSYYTSYSYSGGSADYPRFLDIASIGSPDGTNGGGIIRFLTNPVTANASAVERARIDSSGNLLVGTTSSILGAVTGSIQSLSSSANNSACFANSNASTPYGPYISFSAAAPNNTSQYFLTCADNAATRATIRSNGGLANYQSNNADLSDIRTKKDIKPVASYWNKIAAIEIVSFKYKDQTDDVDNIGVIAQQVESVAPEFVDASGFGDTPDDGVPLKTIYNKDVTFAAIKALQEAMARIEKLEAEVSALKGA